VLSAKGYLQIMEEGPGFSRLLWSFVGGAPKVNRFRGRGDVPTATPESIAMSKELIARGFKFVGPTIVYAFMQAVGMVNDHFVSCHCHARLASPEGAIRASARKTTARKATPKKGSVKKSPAETKASKTKVPETKSLKAKTPARKSRAS